MLIMDDDSIGISSVNSTVLAARMNEGISEKNPKMKVAYEKRGAGWHLFLSVDIKLSALRILCA